MRENNENEKQKELIDQIDKNIQKHKSLLPQWLHKYLKSEIVTGVLTLLFTILGIVKLVMELQ